MAEARAARCPECGNEITTRAQPNTRLRCRGCAGSFLAPPLDPELAEPDDVPLGPTVERVPAVVLPVAPVAPPADPVPPRGNPSEPANPPDDPPPDPPASVTEPTPSARNRKYGKWGRSR